MKLTICIVTFLLVLSRVGHLIIYNLFRLKPIWILSLICSMN